MKIAIIGGGASGFFAAIQLKEQNPNLQVELFEKHNQYLSKVRISGGGRCNVTHDCFDPRLLIEAYPRGHKQLLRGFYHFGPEQMIEWLKDKGVELKTEKDGRMFPITDSSQTIIDLFLKRAKELEVKLHPNTPILSVQKQDSGFLLETGAGDLLNFEAVIVATGSINAGYQIALQLGHTIIPPVPSLFTFVVEDPDLKALSGTSFKEVKIKLIGSKHETKGPLLITHWGLSGPAILKLSAFAARELQEKEYKGQILIDLLPESSLEEVFSALLEHQENNESKMFGGDPGIESLTARFWKYFIGEKLGYLKWGKVDNKILRKIALQLKQWTIEIAGKSTYKEEFVTAGGVSLKEVDLCTFESKIVPGLYFVGEVLDVDAITGGYNFQNAWTSSYLVAKHIANKDASC